ncbi:RNA polymerase sigma factor SigJ [Paenibacillus sacheonensis]|uniref:Sigma-70 family RNA polymerase sigma factor n=1 Tax=Paenibacillus sacheonensis TaxID=742054 RepID=A0A7X4YJY6_9BACL|nr:RNA polymerase sigma factor SigJ [Paenibacillus sacheonensis]MBM7563893.1 RNA polymerase sigma-70 factor (ECF subfamily) [Paenibacillus sacheonensis]NBC67760.1 sigma-70 family RNA polymerase sigma factor [Paenibacillus sacheonensis]
MQELYKQYKALLFTLAYQLTGSVSDAEDVVQDVFLKIYDVPPEKLTEPKAYLCKMVTNRCRDMHKSARNKREQYYGEWLPEPFVSPYDDNTMDSVVRDDLLSYAMLVLLERLSVTERIIFVLREALGFDYREIAELTEKSEANCRKLFSRASAKMGVTSEELDHAEPANSEWVEGFLGALKQGNLNQILSMLDQDALLVSDGGGKVTAAGAPIESRDLVAQFLLGPIRQASMVNGEPTFELASINGQTAFILRSRYGVHTVGLLHVEGDTIRSIYVIRNPDKLTHVSAVLLS